MRAAGVFLGLALVAVLVVAYVNYQYDWPFRILAPAPAVTSNNANVPGSGAYVARYSNARGLQDAPRNDVAQGETIDMQHCLNTMSLRGLKPAVAQHTCSELIAGISR